LAEEFAARIVFVSFVCFVSVTSFPVCTKTPLLQSIVQRLFAKHSCLQSKLNQLDYPARPAIVLFDPERDYREGHILDANGLPDGIDIAEQIGHYGRAEHGDFICGIHILLGNGDALGNDNSRMTRKAGVVPNSFGFGGDLRCISGAGIIQVLPAQVRWESH
jgi:hypothetical protein